MKKFIYGYMFVGFVMAILFVACAPEVTTANPHKVNTETGARIVIVSASTFVDQRSYTRDILVLRDTQTGKEYLAVMGAGVVDMYPQSCGKTTCMIENP